MRAVDTRSGEDTNLVREALAAPASPDTKAPLFDGLLSAEPGAGCGETTLTWAAARETCSTPVLYEVHRSTSPGFAPSAATRIGSSSGLSLVDAALDPATDYYYVVCAVDQEGLSDGNTVEKTAEATVLAEVISTEDFEGGANGWTLSGTNDAQTGLWELGDPDQNDAQPGDCPSGTSCWATGLSGSSLGENDIDDGTTTLLSAGFSLLGLESPAIRYKRYYSNNTGSAAGTDSWVVEISNDDGGNWDTVEDTQSSDSGLVFRDFEWPLPAGVSASDTMRVRFIAADVGEGSVVEAVLDDFETVDLVGGCDDCAPAPAVDSLLVQRDGDDVVLDWSGFASSAGRYKVYTLEGAAFDEQSLLGTSTEKALRHESGTLYGTLTSYRVSAVNACGEEGPLS